MVKQYIEEAEAKGEIKRTGLYVCDAVDSFILDDENKFLIECIMDTYLFYLKQFDLLEEHKEAFLKTLKQEEIKRNQALENENPFVIEVLMNYNSRRYATDLAVKEKLEGRDCTIQTLCRIHKTLLNGLAASDEQSKLRSTNTTFVGKKIMNDNPAVMVDAVSYLPIDYQDIKEALERVLVLYNKKEFNSQFDLFTNPILVHGLIAALQCFNDGNTRLARIMQHVNALDLTNKLTDVKCFKSPAIYTSEAIIRLGKREEYRTLIKDIAINPNNETLNEWIKFNMLLLEQQIFLNQDKITECAQVLQRTKKQR